MERAKNLQTEWARLLIDGIASAGVTDAIISPGSRSTPFVCAALEHEAIRCRSLIDERSAAHFALGQARVTGVPSLLICTSGSAAANYFPAITEAYEGRVPVVVLTADRPPELQHCGANQTMDQLHLFGTRARFFANLGEPVASEQALRAVRRTAIRAVAESIAHQGPVHLNAQAREPLEPQVARDPDCIALASLCRSIRAEGAVAGAVPTPRLADGSHLDWVAAACARAERGVIVCGPSPVHHRDARDAVTVLADRTGFPVVAEAASQFRFLPGASRVVFDASDALWRSEHARAAFQPDLVLQVGDAPVSKGWARLMAQDFPRQHVLVTEHGWPDPTARACRVVRGSVQHSLVALADRLSERQRSFVWRERLMSAQAVVHEVRANVLEDAGNALSEGWLASAVVAQLPEGAALVLGNSLPIRQVEAWAGPRETPLDVFCQRGLSGIDGVVSAAAGVASKRPGPTLLLVGDVSFLHDLNGLGAARELGTPFVIVVANNRGGRIFEQLPIARSQPEAVPLFTTPHEASLAHAAAVYGHRFHAVRTVDELGRVLRESLSNSGCTVIEASVPDTGALEQNLRLWHEVDRRLRESAR